MNFVTDSAVLAFKYFRLGGSVELPDHVKYYSLTACAQSHGSVEGEKIHHNEVPLRVEGSIRICILSDTHERHHLFRTVPPCDILVHAGDILMTGRMISHERAEYEMARFNKWLGKQSAAHRLVIGGNHDLVLETLGHEQSQALLTHATYLCNSSTDVMGLHIFGSPLSTGASGNCAFQTHEFAADAHDKVSQIAQAAREVDILITHGPCNSLGKAVKPRLMHISGHVHAHHGVRVARNNHAAEGEQARQWFQVAAPIMDHRYNPTQLPIVVDVPLPAAATATL
jgi:predicted phosphodiesterase